MGFNILVVVGGQGLRVNMTLGQRLEGREGGGAERRAEGTASLKDLHPG